MTTPDSPRGGATEMQQQDLGKTENGQTLEPELKGEGSTGRARILVCGGRDYDDENRVWSTLDYHAMHRGVYVIINGGATGADGLSTAWANARGVPCLSIGANWKREGRAAGPIRNQRMIDEQKPTLVVAFPGGRGTADMVRRARAAGIEVIEVNDARDGATDSLAGAPVPAVDRSRSYPNSAVAEGGTT